MIPETAFTFVSSFQINILINQITGRVNYAADLIGVRMASINQILDPWLYILLRKRVIMKVIRYILNIVLCRRTASPKRSRHFYSSSQGKHSYTEYRERNNSHELKHFGSDTNIRVTVNEDPGVNLDNKNSSLNRRGSQSDPEMSDSSANSLSNLISTESDIKTKDHTRTRLRRSWSLDGALNTNRKESVHVQQNDKDDLHELNSPRNRKPSIQSFFRVLQWKANGRKPSLPAKLHSVGNNSV